MRLPYFFLLFFYSLCACASQPMNVIVDAHDAQFTIQLPANPTTGYRWVLADFDSENIQKKSEKYIAGEPKRIGSGGKMCFIFKKIKPSTKIKETTLTFKYQRSWEEKPVDVQTVVVHFKKPK